MSRLFRGIGLLFRRRSDRQAERKTLQTFSEWSTRIGQMDAAETKPGKTALVRLDDIGDYLLFRNFLNTYSAAFSGPDKQLTLVGNVVWKPIYEAFDLKPELSCIWVDKHQYFADQVYRETLWQKVRKEGFEQVVCAARTRPLLLEDCIASASNAPIKKACANSFPSISLNTASNRLYTALFPMDDFLHEFAFNANFAAWVTDSETAARQLALPLHRPENPSCTLCFIGASAKSKRWPAAHWIKLIALLQQSGLEPVLSGGKNELPLAEEIVAATGVSSLVGQTDLNETLDHIANAKAVVSGDTMAAHAAVACRVPVVILANGVNAWRFVSYQDAGYQAVTTLYTQAYRAVPADARKNFKAVSNDMKSIYPGEVLTALQQLLRC